MEFGQVCVNKICTDKSIQSCSTIIPCSSPALNKCVEGACIPVTGQACDSINRCPLSQQLCKSGVCVPKTICGAITCQPH